MSRSAKVRLTAACGDYDITRALINGDVAVQGADVIVLTMPSPERHWRLLRHHEFDICELSMASYLAMCDADSPPYIALPVFPHRRFRHSYLFVNAEAGITSPKDLEGKSIGIRTWQNTAALWMRGILQEHYGVCIQSIDWLAQDEEDVPIDPAAAGEFNLRRVPAGKDVDRMLVEGETHGLLYPEVPPSFRKRDPRIRRLWPDSRAEEQRFFAQTGIFPIMHTVVVRQSLLDEYPWLGLEVVKAFRRAKEHAWHAMEDPRRVSLAWFREAVDEQRAVLGDDPWPYDLPNNRRALEALCAYAHAQGLTSRRLQVEELFHPGSIDEPPKYVGA
jgi:4,5-dihydroxyphthalate decarboxylase